MINHNKPLLATKLIEAIGNPIFPELDTQLRAGKHICTEDLEKHNFIHEYFKELDSFYRRYNVELVCAPEEFYYLRTKSTSIIASSQLTELEMMAGKILCLLYLSPEKLAQAGVFTVQEVYDELLSLVEVERLVKLINPRSTGSDIDKAKLMEKLRSALNRLSRMGILTYFGKEKKDRNKFLIRSACFRFGADVRSGEDASAAQLKLIQSGEAVTTESLAQAEKAKQEEASTANTDANATTTAIDEIQAQAAQSNPTNKATPSNANLTDAEASQEDADQVKDSNDSTTDESSADNQTNLGYPPSSTSAYEKDENADDETEDEAEDEEWEDDEEFWSDEEWDEDEEDWDEDWEDDEDEEEN